jgi:hypothetical protein
MLSFSLAAVVAGIESRLRVIYALAPFGSIASPLHHLLYNVAAIRKARAFGFNEKEQIMDIGEYIQTYMRTPLDGSDATGSISNRYIFSAFPPEANNSLVAAIKLHTPAVVDDAVNIIPHGAEWYLGALDTGVRWSFCDLQVQLGV